MRLARQEGLGQAYFKVLYESNGAYAEVLPTSSLGIIRARPGFLSNLKFVGRVSLLQFTTNMKC
jgi:hypothetical protein